MDFSAPDWYNRFHYFRSRKLQISWFHNVLTCFRALKTRFIYLWEGQDTSQNIRKYMGTSRKDIIYRNLRTKQIQKKTKDDPQFVLNLLFLYFVYTFWVYVFKITSRRWGIENYTFFIIKQHPNLDMNFVCVKNMNIFLL